MRRLFGILLNGPGSDVSSQAQALAAFLGTEIETIETADSLSLRNSVQEGTKSLLEALTRVCQDVKHGKVPAGGSEWEDPIRDFGIQLIKRWFDEGKGIDEVVEAAVSVAGAAVANQARGVCTPNSVILHGADERILVCVCSGCLSVGSVQATLARYRTTC